MGANTRACGGVRRRSRPVPERGSIAKFIVETDLGHDPDDFFALCYLVTAGHELVAVSIVPGSPEQVRLAGLLRDRTGQRFLIGTAKPQAKPERLGVHDRLMEREKAGDARADVASADVLRAAFAAYPDADVLVIGPALGLGKVITGRTVGRLTFQGGFLPYSVHRPAVVDPAFEGRDWVPTFNFNGDRKAVDAVLAADVSRRQFVGKNVCHTVFYDRERHDQLASARDEASRLFQLCMDLYLEHHDGRSSATRRPWCATSTRRSGCGTRGDQSGARAGGRRSPAATPS